MPAKTKTKTRTPGCQAFTDALVAGELERFSVGFENQNELGEHCWLTVDALHRVRGQPKQLFLDLMVGEDGESVARAWVRDRSKIVAAIRKLGRSRSVPTDREIMVASLTIDGKGNLTTRAHDLVVAMLAEVFVVTPASLAVAAKRAANKVWRDKRSAARKAAAIGPDAAPRPRRRS